MKVKNKKTGEIQTVDYFSLSDGSVISPKDVEILPEEGQKVWIARDSKFDPMFGLGLHVHWKNPVRTLDSWSSDSILVHLSWEKYPEVTWEGGPKEIRLCLG